MAEKMLALTRPAAVPAPALTSLLGQRLSWFHTRTDESRGTTSLIGATSPGGTDATSEDLFQAYSRLQQTLSANDLTSHPSYDHLAGGHSLARVLGHSISTVEIAARGNSAIDAATLATLLDGVSQPSLMHLRVLSGTITSYLALGALRDGGNNVTTHGLYVCQHEKIFQLFGGRASIETGAQVSEEGKVIVPLLEQDPFQFMTEFSPYTASGLSRDFHHVVRLCYLAEIIRVILVFAFARARAWPFAESPDGSEPPETESDIADSAQHLSEMIQLLMKRNGLGEHNSLDPGCRFVFSNCIPDSSTTRTYERLHQLISKYALVFLRKTVILMHVRYGVDFKEIHVNDTSAPELDRLSEVLRLPSLYRMYEDFCSNATLGIVSRTVASRWLVHWEMWLLKASPNKGVMPVSIRLNHPAIYELIGLPKHYDTLVDEATKRRCPTTGKELSDPAVCLFCGDIFCSQAVCCSYKRLGGCTQHMKVCSAPVGLFINIRKCMVLFMYNGNGSWFHAPYLDKHGEVDPALRRHHQLFLHQKRYDTLLRDVWLSNGIPSAISRRLEGDTNTGGWETL
ncbi:E3 ubiquitin-protein ligase ubr1 [Elasticomyces elasticus]|nr:E3 ubiquitin-protein ligase ubr1 [Elasticomyces elasticus]